MMLSMAKRISIVLGKYLPISKITQLQAELLKGESGEAMTSKEYASSFMKKCQAYLQQTKLQP